MRSMNSFEQWLQTTSHSGVQKYANTLLKLGVSWETFRRERNEIVNDLVYGEIPRLVASDIVTVVLEALSQSSRPLSIFWDMENVPIPSSMSGAEVASRLKSTLSSHGMLVQFRGYASIGLNHIPEHKRSELHLSGCHLVDCPHLGRKEVADKMIIVDAMEFAFNHIQEGAVMVFITGDMDYAYLFGKLRKPQWKTIVISKGTSSMLHAHCDTHIEWEKEVLVLYPRVPPGFAPLGQAQEVSIEEDAFVEQATLLEEKSSYLLKASSAKVVSDSLSNKDIISSSNKISVDDGVSCKTFANKRMNEKDVKLLRDIVRSYAHVGGPGPGTLKCHVGSLLRQQYPDRFPDRIHMQQFLATAISTGVVVEGDEYGSRVLYLPEKAHNVTPFTMFISKVPPLPLSKIPPKIIQKCSNLPFVLFLMKKNIPAGQKLPDKTMVQSSGIWIMLMFRTLNDAQSIVRANPWLASGDLVNWYEVIETPTKQNLLETTKTFLCTSCNLSLPSIDSFFNKCEVFCRPCFELNPMLWNADEKLKVSEKVVSMLQMMAENDDVLVYRNILRGVIIERWPLECGSREQAALWLDAAIGEGGAKELKTKGGGKSKSRICLSKNVHWADVSWPVTDFDTTAEEEFVVDLLWDHGGSVERKVIIGQLEKQFPDRMDTPLKRTQMFVNAAMKEKFFVAKGLYGQVVGLTKADAQTYLDHVFSLQLSCKNADADNGLVIKIDDEASFISSAASSTDSS